MSARTIGVALALACTAACSSRTGVVLTVRATDLHADQLRVTASVDGRTLVRLAPESASSAPLAFPTSVFAELDDRAWEIAFTVEALDHGVPIASAAVPALTLAAHEVAHVEVALPSLSTAPPPDAMPDAMPDDAGTPGRVAYADVVLADAPIAYYRLDETSSPVAHDSSGHALHGTYGPAVTRGAPSLLTGDSNGAATFNGGNASLDGLVLVPPSPLLEPTTVSVELWLRQSVFNADFAVLMVYDASLSDSLPPPYATFLFGKSLNLIYWTTSNTGDDPALHTVTQPGLNQTYHFVQTYDGEQLRMYVNGVLETQYPLFGDFVLARDRTGLGIGGSPVGFGTLFAGTLDEVAIYGSALTPQQVQKHFLAGSTR